MSSTSNSNLSKSPGKSNIWTVPQDKLKIIIRIRPVLNEEQETQFVELQNNNTLQIKRPGNYTYMKFSNILPYYSTQKDVFNLLQESINQFLSGTNITIFAYGQTGAGKTYSIIGNYSSSPNSSGNSMLDNDNQNIYHLLSSEERGILSRSLQMIMQAIQCREINKISISFFQIYNQKIFDLYNKEGSGALEIRQSKNGQISIPNLISIEITRIEEAIHYLMIGLKNRSTGSTHANAKSSRSHSIFQINLQKQGKTSSLRIVDLAGSEKFKIPSDITAAEKEIRIQQLTNINGSLSCLGHCISALIQKSRTHIPFRNSKLTRILSDSLLGQGKMRFIICISPSISASAQTFSTLQFANRAKRAIFDRAEMRTPNMSKKKSENEQMLMLKKQLQKQRQRRVQYEQQIGHTKKQNIYLKIQNQKLQSRIKQISLKVGNTSESSNIDKKVSKQSKICFKEKDSQNFETEEKENNLHEQMLNLPIFQKNRTLIQNTSNSSCSVSRNKPLNVKKAQFQKKIRKFIEQSSPEDKQKNINTPGKQQLCLSELMINQNNRNGISNFRNQSIDKSKDNLKTQFSRKNHIMQNDLQYQLNKKMISGSELNPNLKQKFNPSKTNYCEQNEEELDSLWQYQEEETQQFFQRACQKMKMKQYEDLKAEMEKAKSQLIKFKQLDDRIQKKKISVVR